VIDDNSPNPPSAAKGASTPIIPHKAPAAGTGSLEAALDREHNPVKKFLKVLGPGLVTGASDDDPSGIGTYVVGSERGAVLASQPARFIAPSSEPDVRLTTHPALHVFMPLGFRSWSS